MIITSNGWVSLRGVRLDWHRPFEIWKVANKGQQPLVSDIQRSELWGLPFILWLVSGSLSIFALSFIGLRKLIPFRLIVCSRFACDHDGFSRCMDIVF